MTDIFKEKFQQVACTGDRISVAIGRYTITARIVYDELAERQDPDYEGFWPSITPNDAGFIGKGNNQANLQAWLNDEWFYCGVVLSVNIGNLELTDDAASLWGVEVNYPGMDNSCLTELANEMLPDALDVAKLERKRLLTILKETN